MATIEFKRTAHTMLNNGIIGVYNYLKKAEKEGRFDFEFKYELTDNKLQIECKELCTLLEELYYWMGKDYYDTYTTKQQKQVDEFKGCNIYVDIENEKGFPFPKIYTYGLTHLLTNNAAGKPRNKNNLIRIKNLEKEQTQVKEYFNHAQDDSKTPEEKNTLIKKLKKISSKSFREINLINIGSIETRQGINNFIINRKKTLDTILKIHNEVNIKPGKKSI